MQNTVTQIKQFVFSLDPNKVRLITVLATMVAGVVTICSPGAGSGIGG
jgi:hypothetical protein